MPNSFYHFAFEAGSEAGLHEKRNELLARGVRVTEVVDHEWAQSIYFEDPNGIQLEFCCFTRNLTANDARMQDREGLSGSLSRQEAQPMNTSSDPVRLPSGDDSITPVTILDAQGRVVRVVSAEEFRSARLEATAKIPEDRRPPVSVRIKRAPRRAPGVSTLVSGAPGHRIAS